MSIYRASPDAYRVVMPKEHPNFSYVDFQRKASPLEYVVVEVDPRRFMACYDREGGRYIPKVLEWPQPVIENIQAMLEPRAVDSPMLAMPIAKIKINKRTAYPRFFGWLKLFGKTIDEPVVEVTNGRYSARYLEHVGVAAFPVQVELSQAALMIEHFAPIVPNKIFD